VAVGWRRNLFAVTAASFMGFTGFTLVMPFLPLFIRQLGVSDVGAIALWTGLSLGVTPALNAMVSPFWGRLADRVGRKLMIGRSMTSCVLVMASMAFVTRAWHVLALRAVLGLLTGYGGLSLTMAAESAPADQMARAIGVVQTAQRLGPAVGPLIGGTIAALVGLRRAFLVTACFYAVGLLLVVLLYDEKLTHARPGEPAERGRVTFRNVLRFENFVLLMLVIFAVQFVDRSFGPILPLYIERLGVSHARVALVAGIIFSIAAFAGAAGHHLCGRLLANHSARRVISGGAAASCAGSVLMALAPNAWLMAVATGAFGLGAGLAMTASYTVAALVIPAGAHGSGFGVLTSASLTGLAVSPVVSGLLGDESTMRLVFVVDAVMMAGLVFAVRRRMVTR
jgi:DHA1 family multidrug resistance protein-like MFS transporter